MRKINVYIWIGITITILVIVFGICWRDSVFVSMGCCLILIGIFLFIWRELRKLDKQWVQMLAERDARIRAVSEGGQERIRLMEAGATQLRRELAHSVRMPLAIITGYSDLLERGSYRSEEEKGIYIDKICKNIHHLNHTFRMILDEQSEEHQQEYQMVDLRRVVQEVADQVCEYVQSHMIRITVNGSREHIYIHGSEMELMRIFHNLIENSVKYMKHGDAIYITIEQVGQDAIVIYRDNGEGISSEEAEVVVEQGRQESNVTNQNYHEGSGTGLYLVNEIVKKHKGSMEIRSSEGKGFAVYLTFPTVAMTEKPVVEESLRNL